MAAIRSSGPVVSERSEKNRRAVLIDQRRPDRFQILARVEPLGNGGDRLTERLPVAQEGGAGEHVDLAAGVVDVVLARHAVAGVV